MSMHAFGVPSTATVTFCCRCAADAPAPLTSHGAHSIIRTTYLRSLWSGVYGHETEHVGFFSRRPSCNRADPHRSLGRVLQTRALAATRRRRARRSARGGRSQDTAEAKA